MAETRPRSSLLQFAVIFLAVYLLTQFTFEFFFPEQFNGEPKVTGVVLRPLDSTVKGGHHPILTIDNFTEEEFTLPDRCPMPPVDIVRIVGTEQFMQQTEETAVPCKPVPPIAPGDRAQIDLAPWKYSLFGDYAEYEARLPNVEPVEEAEDLHVARFAIYEAGTITQIFRTFISKPLLNFLIFIASLLPGHNLGLAIIILTIIVKLILFFPTQHALEGQKKMQAIQPKIDALRKKYKDDPQRLNQETLKLWKTEKVNPFESCLPMLLQFPVLIGIFFVIRDGSHLELSRHLIYSMYQNLSWSWDTHFLGLELLEPSIYFFPPFLVIAQFIQMKLSFAIAKKKKDATEDPKQKEKKKDDDPMASTQEMQQKIMTYALPLMIGFFAFQFPAAVSLYWGVSTVFAIGQQIVVNRKHLA